MSVALRELLQRQCGRDAILLATTSRTASGFSMTPAESQTLKKEFWEKNQNLKRPMSPHLTIYKFPLPARLSILHRASGIGISGVVYGAGIGALFASGTSFPEIIQLIQSNVPQFLILSTKTAIGGGLIYHTLNGIRHLMWDIGYGFQLKHLYLSGYLVVALTAIGTVLIFIRG